MNTTVDGDWLRLLADLVDQGVVEVIKCEPNTGGVLLGVVNPRSKKSDDEELPQG